MGGGAFALLKIVGNTHLKAEELRNVETGYRAQINDRLSFDATAFLSFYSNLLTHEPGRPFINPNPMAPYPIVPIVFGNLAGGRGYGGEVFGNWKANNRWTISPSYSLLYTATKLSPESADAILNVAAASPRNQFQIRSSLNLGRHLEWDSSIGYVGELPNAVEGVTPRYARLDTRLGWHIGECIELSVVGQNLLTPQHLEFYADYPVQPAWVSRRVSAKVTWRF